ncbi:phosphatidylserine decarboxylase proenzyme, mitochondrial [Cimex lectularius]|uniref:phosphatidylserine decarboxylase n=1 Tax=Cimex lectularius TaxID=79782 RepID=A0A8I6RDZ9_CIMLE|nr:phosphatidylserine decarboxylase proenzyme, mitochondrial [Cimex lectularius]
MNVSGRFIIASNRSLTRRRQSTHTGGSGRGGLFRRIWDSWIPIPTGVGLTLLGVLQLRRMDRERKRDREEELWEMKVYKMLPLRSLSRGAGVIAEFPIPELLRKPLFSTYSKLFGVDVAEMSEPYDSFCCFADFFTRSLRDGCRPLADSAIVSPADGRVMASCKVRSFKIEQVKGATYSIQEFLGRPPHNEKYFEVSFDSQKVPYKSTWNEYKHQLLKNPKNELYQCVIYLSPGNYHRFHSPADIRVNFRRHIPGYLMSVNPKIAGILPGLFSMNERVIYTGEWQEGFFSLTAVGATNVGSIRVYKDDALTTNRQNETSPLDRELSFTWRKGEEIGEFRIGSTVVLLFEAPPDFQMDMAPNDTVRVGIGLSKNY